MVDVSPLALGGSKVGETFTGTHATDNELWLKLFGGEVLAAFDQEAKIQPLVTSRTLTAGKSAQFPIHGRARARAHKPGESIYDSTNTASGYHDADASGLPQAWAIDGASKYLNNLDADEKTITINDMLVSPIFIDDLDEAKAHYDLRQIYTMELGRAIARKADNMCVRSFAAAAAASVTGPLRGGQSVTDAGLDTQTDILASGILDGVQKLDEYDVPRDGRVIILDPARFYLLLRAAGGIGATDSYAGLLSKDYSNQNGDFANGEVLRVAGVPVVVSNNTGFGINFSTNPSQGEQNSLDIDMTNYVGLVVHKSAAGMVKLKDIQLETDYDISRQGHLFVSKLAAGFGPLRSDAAVALKTA